VSEPTGVIPGGEWHRVHYVGGVSHSIDERRRSSKVVILDGEGAVLLFCGGDPARPEAGVWWFLPGGGLASAESFEDAAVREVQEETGYVIDDPGPIVLRREFDFQFNGRRWRADEVYFIVKTTRFDVSSEGWDDIERQSIVEHRWWGLDELVDTQETVHPAGLAELIVRHR
jgi:8-oxo-dGTP pyrophosphatase MutT (NUDIX family)